MSKEKYCLWRGIVKVQLKGYIAGFLSAVLMLTGTVVFAESIQSIEAVFGRVKLVISDEPVEQETLLYDGTTYVPLRAAAELLGKEVAWDGETQTAYIDEPGTGRVFEKKEETPETTPPADETEDRTVKLKGVEELYPDGPEVMFCYIFEDGFELRTSNQTTKLSYGDISVVVVGITGENAEGDIMGEINPTFKFYKSDGSECKYYARDEFVDVLKELGHYNQFKNSDSTEVQEKLQDLEKTFNTLADMSFDVIYNNDKTSKNIAGSFYVAGSADMMVYDDGIHRVIVELE